MSKTKKSEGFRFPMTKAERIFGILYIPVFAVVLAFLVPWVCMKLTDGEMSAPYINLCYYGFSFLVVLICMFRYLRLSFSDIFDGFGRFLKSVIFGYVFYYAMLYAVSVVLTLVLESTINPNSQEILNETRLNRNVMIVTGVFLAPILEESLFRGALFGTIRQKSRIVAYIVSIVVFALYHLWQSFYVDGFSWTLVLYLLQYIPGSVALAWCYEKSGTIWSSITLHAIINLISITVSINLNM